MDGLTLVLVAVDDAMAEAWNALAAGRLTHVRRTNGAAEQGGGPSVKIQQLVVYQGSITDVDVDAVVSPANSFGFMGGGIDGVYARWFPGISDRVRAASGADRGGELPVGEAVVVPTGVERPAWLVSAPTMRRPGERLAPDGAAALAAATAVLRLWRDGTLPTGARVRDEVRSVALPGLGTGVGGLSPDVCARQVGAALDEVFG